MRYKSWSIAAIDDLKMPNTQLRAELEFKRFHSSLCMMQSFPHPLYQKRKRCWPPIHPVAIFPDRCSSEVQSLVSQFQAFTARTHRATYTEPTYTHSLRVPLARRNYDLVGFFPRSVMLWNRLPKEFFLDHDNFNHFKSRVNRYISCIYS